jgi:uncharacterized ubiquitin-like protein YukD
MANIEIVVTDAVGARTNKVELPDDVSVGRVIAKLITPLSLPLTAPDGQPMAYKFHHVESGRQLVDNSTLAQSGISNGDTLRLVPEIVAG